MKKLLNLNSFFTKIILAILSFAVIICIFIPYTQVPAVKAVHDIDVNNRELSIYIGKEAETVNIISEFCAGQPFLIFKDEALKDTVAIKSIPTPNAENIYYMELYAYGYDKNHEEKKLDYISLGVYKIILQKDTKNDSPVLLSRDNNEKTVTIRVPNATNFDFTRVIDSRKAWARYPNAIAGALDGRSSDNEVTSLSVKQGKTEEYNIAISLKSEVNPNSMSDEPSEVFYPLEMYKLTVKRDANKKTLPTVGEIGLGVLSARETAKNDDVTAFYTGDAVMFAFMIVAAISTLGAFIIPPKFKFIGLIISGILGLGLIVTPLLDYFMFFSSNKFNIEAGWFILMILGLLIVLAAVFDYIRCTAEYRAEQIRLFGEDAFKKKAKEPKAKKEKKQKEVTESVEQ